jgi:peptidoglycan/xylan/chitin deacetylase (PgdA/CDA1 family)
VSQELILTFHGLGTPPERVPDGERSVWVPLEWFEAIVDAPLGDGVSLAFDDGNASDVREALPALGERGITARFFPLTGRIGTAGYLTAEDIVSLRDAGMRIGSHGLHHRDWRALDDAELQEELTLSRETLVDITGTEITEAACPFGSYDRRVLRALRAAGYRRVFTSDGGADSSGSWPSSRTTVDRNHPLRQWVQLARVGAGRRPRASQRAKRFAKRMR